MKYDRHTGIKFAAGIVFLLLFACYYSGISFIPLAHTHENSTYVHSHPYKKNCEGEANHTHSQAEYELIALISYFIGSGTLFSVAAVLFFLLLSGVILLFEESNIPLGKTVRSKALRAPPVPAL